ncbi:uncharacterized protein BDR25DRAFT_360806 [Lindgomyces ingoldianus]|uniref:Uncharacterized protein n=1 Tax=Lindgomyces ingoldianus TaxID=673940 RepID=A0ACB6QDX2_9PLEO|nr:uncharacterized protein BDR25DRAFT_360806 [Lindgomyces ingoldianus]KAF2465178.1 hypothetical protein BDR25DRAFT_360806 [Lindgomyces ingoldianus]
MLEVGMNWVCQKRILDVAGGDPKQCGEGELERIPKWKSGRLNPCFRQQISNTNCLALPHKRSWTGATDAHSHTTLIVVGFLHRVVPTEIRIGKPLGADDEKRSATTSAPSVRVLPDWWNGQRSWPTRSKYINSISARETSSNDRKLDGSSIRVYVKNLTFEEMKCMHEVQSWGLIKGNPLIRGVLGDVDVSTTPEQIHPHDSKYLGGVRHLEEATLGQTRDEDIRINLESWVEFGMLTTNAKNPRPTVVFRFLLHSVATLMPGNRQIESALGLVVLISHKLGERLGLAPVVDWSVQWKPICRHSFLCDSLILLHPTQCARKFQSEHVALLIPGKKDRVSFLQSTVVEVLHIAADLPPFPSEKLPLDMSSTVYTDPSIGSSPFISSHGEKMQTIPTPPPSPHPFLPPSRVSTISSWTSTLPERGSRPRSTSEADPTSRDAAIEAYRKLKLALFSKARCSLLKYVSRFIANSEIEHDLAWSVLEKTSKAQTNLDTSHSLSFSVDTAMVVHLYDGPNIPPNRRFGRQLWPAQSQWQGKLPPRLTLLLCIFLIERVMGKRLLSQRNIDIIIVQEGYLCRTMSEHRVARLNSFPSLAAHNALPRSNYESVLKSAVDYKITPVLPLGLSRQMSCRIADKPRLTAKRPLEATYHKVNWVNLAQVEGYLRCSADCVEKLRAPKDPPPATRRGTPTSSSDDKAN